MQRHFRTLFTAVVVALGLAAAPHASQASPIALTVSGGSLDTHGNNNDLGGWVFTTSNTISVTALGMLATNLTSDHFVGIYNNAGQLLVGETVSRLGVGEGAVGTQQFTYTDLSAAALLGPGQYFIAESYLNHDPFLLNAGVPVLAAGLTYNGFGLYTNVVNANQNQAGTRLGPGNFNPGEAFFGPNFKFDVVTVPAPGSLALLGLGLIGAARLRRTITAS